MLNTKRIFTAACVGILIFGMSFLALGSVLPHMVEKFQVDKLAAGAVASILPLGVLIGSLFFGPLADRYGYKGLLVTCCLLVAAGLEGLALGGSWAVVEIAVFLIGAGGGALNGSTSALVADISEGQRGARLSILGVFFGVGALGMPAVLAILSPYTAQERVISVIGFLVLATAGWLLTLQYPQPKHSEGLPIRQGLRMLKNPAMLLLCFVLFFESGVEGLISSWTTSYSESELHLSAEKALILLTAHVGALAAMRLLLGSLLRTHMPYRILAMGVTFAFAGSLVLWTGSGYLTGLTAMILLGAGFAGVFPIMMGKIGDLWSNLSGTAFSIALVIALSGNILINYLMGLLAHEFGMVKFPILLTVSMLFLAAMTIATANLFGDRTRRRERTTFP